VNNWFATESLATTNSHSLTFSAPLTDNVTIKDLVGLRFSRVEATNQLSGLGGLYTSDLAAFGLDFYPPGTPFLPLENATVTQQNTLSNELQFNIDTARIKSTVGYLYYHSRGQEGGFPGVINTLTFSGLASPAFIGFSAPILTGRYPYEPTQDKILTVSHAGYTQNEVHVTDKLDVVGGLRFTKDERNGIDGSPAPAGPPTAVNYSKGTWTYLVGLDYKITSDIFTYLHYSTGYISGGQLANIVFNPETAMSWEAGIKSDVLDRTLRLNLAVFTVRYDDVQTLTTPQVPGEGCYAVPDVSHTAGQCIVNGGDAKATGFEFEGTYVTPIAGVTLTGNTAYNNFHFTKVVSFLRAADGTFVPEYTPRWTADVAAQYRGHEFIGSAYPIARIDTNYTSSTFPGANAPLAQLEASVVPARWLLNGRLGVAGFTAAGANIDLSLYGKNLTNNRGETYSAGLGFVLDAQYQRARTFGVELDGSF
jgi:iron complex outermembrane receptor protein